MKKHRLLSDSSCGTATSRETGSTDVPSDYCGSELVRIPAGLVDTYVTSISLPTIGCDTGVHVASDNNFRDCQNPHEQLNKIFQKPVAHLEDRSKKFELEISKLQENRETVPLLVHSHWSSLAHRQHDEHSRSTRHLVQRHVASTNRSGYICSVDEKAEECNNRSDNMASYARRNVMSASDKHHLSLLAKANHNSPTEISSKPEPVIADQSSKIHNNSSSEVLPMQDSDANTSRHEQQTTVLGHDVPANEEMKNTLEPDLRAIKERDIIINNYQLQDMIDHRNIMHQLDVEYAEIQKLRKNYVTLKKLFLTLGILNIIIIMSVVSVMSVISDRIKLSHDGAIQSDDNMKRLITEQLSSPEGKQVVSKHLLCVSCSSVNGTLAAFFITTDDQICCIEDITTLLQRILNINMQRVEECSSIFNTLDISRSQHNLDYQRLQFEVTELQIAVFNTSGGDAKPYGSRPLHPGIQRNNELINTLLTRTHSSIHLNGLVADSHIAWRCETSAGKLSYNGKGIQVQNGGIYFVYSNIRIRTGLCETRRTLGYRVKHKARLGLSTTIASVQISCLNETLFEQDFVIHKIFKVYVGQSSTVFIDLDGMNQDFIMKHHTHYFGMFEI